MQQGTAFSAVLYKNDATDRHTSLIYRGKQTALFCCRGGRNKVLVLMVVAL